MRKFLSYISVILVLMNVMGYYGLLVGLQYKNDLEWQRRIQAGQYLEDDAVLMKIPQAQVGQSLNHADGFDSVFEKEGSVYKLIRQRVHRDTFHIVAIKDQTGTFIKHAIAEYAETFSDNPSQQDPQPLIVLPIFIKEYFPAACTIKPVATGWREELTNNVNTPKLIPSFCSSIIHPPNNI